MTVLVVVMLNSFQHPRRFRNKFGMTDKIKENKIKMEDQRARQRVGFHTSIEIETETGNRFFEDLDNVSMSGFFIKNIAPFTRNKEYHFVIKLICGTKEIDITGRCTPMRFVTQEVLKQEPSLTEGIGFKITYLEPESSEELYKVVTLNSLD